MNGVLDMFDASSLDDLYAWVGEGRIVGREVLLAVYPGARDDGNENVVNLSQARLKHSQDKDSAVAIRGLTPGMAVHISTCCHPLPGDRIVGIVSDGRGVDIHTIDCEQLDGYTDEPDRWIDLAWDPEKDRDVHIGRVNIVVANEPGSLGELSTVIARNHGNISNIKIGNRAPEFFEMMLDIEVRGVKHLTNVIAALRATPAINSVERARG